jgi:hypothetical protein
VGVLQKSRIRYSLLYGETRSWIRSGKELTTLSEQQDKDDTSLASLKKFLAAEETKIMVTGGVLQVEEKFQNSEQIWPKCVILVNSNDWNSKFAYDLDPGIDSLVPLGGNAQ